MIVVEVLAALFHGVIIRVVEDDAVAVVQELLGHAQERMLVIQGVHPAGLGAVIKLGEGDIAIGDGIDIVAVGVGEGDVAVLLRDFLHQIPNGGIQIDLVGFLLEAKA